MIGRWNRVAIFLISLSLQSSISTSTESAEFKDFFCKKNLISIGTGASIALSTISGFTYWRLHTPRIFESQNSNLPVLNAAFLGDSLSTNFKSTKASEIIKIFARGVETGGAFIDIDSSTNSVYSVFERLQKECKVSAACLAKPAAMYGLSDSNELEWGPRAAGLRMMPGQIKQLEELKEFPNLIVLWAGQNDIHRLIKTSENTRLREIADSNLDLNSSYNPTQVIADLEKVIEIAKKQNKKIAVVVFGLNDPESTLNLIQKVEEKISKDSSTYPYYEDLKKWFSGFRPEYRDIYKKLVDRLNRAVPKQIEKINETLGSSQVRVFYADSLSKPFPPDIDLLNADDGVHPSIKGKNQIAERAFEGLQPALNFLK